MCKIWPPAASRVWTAGRIHYSGKTVIAGHTPQTGGEVLDPGYLKVIDTDCSRGGWLTGLEVRTGAIVQANQAGILRNVDIL
jgi:serine/threonine protein phosphatase 1